MQAEKIISEKAEKYIRNLFEHSHLFIEQNDVIKVTRAYCCTDDIKTGFLSININRLKCWCDVISEYLECNKNDEITKETYNQIINYLKTM